MEKDLIYRIALMMTPQIGPVIARALLSHCGSAEEVFNRSVKELSMIPGVGQIKAAAINKDVMELAEKEINYAIKHDIRILSYLCKDYPQRLKFFDTSPVILYTKGEISLNPRRTVGIIGTRKPTEFGKIMTEKIVADLKDYDVTIVSGLAFGVDGIAHRKSIESGIPTIGIMGSGMSHIYPSEHKDLYKKMVTKGGAVMTEFAHNIGPEKVNFPLRNRIIAAMSDALIVVESKDRGGSIITAEFANEYNKDDFAIPGKPGEEYSAGCNGLIKKHKAYLMESVKDIAYNMRWEENTKNKAVQTALFVELDEAERCVYDLLQQKKGATLDELCFDLSSTPSSISTLLLNMEFKGVVRSLPGKKYIIL